MAQNEKGGSDLDVFEGLGKKVPSHRPSVGTKTVPPPPTQASPRPLPDGAKQTLVGLLPPTSPPPPTAPRRSTSAMPSSVGARTPPPPPGRSSLPPVVAPPGRSSANPAGVPTPRVDRAVAAVDVSWEDEDEATHIFDESHEFPKSSTSFGSAGVHAHAGASHGPKATLLGIPAPLPPPTRSSVQPSGLHAGFPPPPGGMLPPPPPATQPGLGLGFSTTRSSLPAPMPPPPHGGSAPPPTNAPATFPRAAAVPTDYAAPPGLEATALLRPPPRRTALWVAVGIAGALIVAAAFVIFSPPRTGRIVVNVIDSKGGVVNHVEIYVDGRKQCDTAPCLIEQVASGSHEVKALAEGFDAPVVQTVGVDGKQDATATFALGPSTKGAGVKVSGTQPGVRLFIDDKETGPLPQEVHDLTLGDHIVRIGGSERYQPLEKHITTVKDQVEDLGVVTLKVLKGKATINPGTPGARAYLVSGTDRRELVTLPISVDIDTAKTWSLEANKPGFDDLKQPISFDDGQAEKTLTVTLEARGPAPAVVPQAAPPQAAPVPQPAPVAQQAAPAPAPAPAPASPPPVAQAAPANEGAGEGFLNINSLPPSTCFVDGRSLGSTPRLHVSVKPGTHTVKFINAEQGLTKTLTVSVGAGETKPAVAKLN